MMKLRIRRGRQTVVVTIDDSQSMTCGILKQIVAEKLATSPEELQLSLNNQTVLDGSSTTSLAELGIVSGDLLHILGPPGVVPETHSANDKAKFACAQSDNKQWEWDTNSSFKHSGSASSVEEHRHCAEGTGHFKSSDVAMETSSSSQHGAPSCSEEKNECGKVSGSEHSEATGSGTGAAAAAEGAGMDEFEMQDEPDAIRDAEVNRYLQEPLLVQECQEGMATNLLRQVYGATAPNDSAEAVCVLLHVLMVESGFLPQPIGTTAEQLPAGWRTPSAFRLNYRHPADDAANLRLIGVTLGQTLIVHGSTEDGENAANPDADSRCKCQLKLKPTDFVKQVNADVTQTYRNLPLLSRLFKDAVSYRLLQSVQAGDQPVVPSLQTLPMEVKLLMLRYLDVCSLARMCRVSRDLQAAAIEPVLWRRLYLIHFGRRARNDLDLDWKNLYKEKYLMRKQHMEQMQRMTFVVPPYMDRPHPPFPMAPFYPPGFIGGDYDLNPDFGGGLRDPFGRHGGRAFMPPQPRFDPIGPLPSQRFRPGRGGGMWDGSGRHFGSGGMGGFPKFF